VIEHAAGRRNIVRGSHGGSLRQRL
jgi:hypothetical protein